jgi:hypothetical protein
MHGFQIFEIIAFKAVLGGNIIYGKKSNFLNHIRANSTIDCNYLISEWISPQSSIFK